MAQALGVENGLITDAGGQILEKYTIAGQSIYKRTKRYLILGKGLQDSLDQLRELMAEARHFHLQAVPAFWPYLQAVT